MEENRISNAFSLAIHASHQRLNNIFCMLHTTSDGAKYLLVSVIAYVFNSSFTEKKNVCKEVYA